MSNNILFPGFVVSGEGFKRDHDLVNAMTELARWKSIC